jgi:multicomponent Na+:H+ antiporter subunit D
MEIGNLPLVIVLMASTILNAGYFVPITYKAFFTGDREKWKREGVGEAPLTMVVPLVIAGLISVALGLFPDFFTGLIGRLF